jgi:hypothetical protein
MFVEFEYASLILPLLAYLVARAIAVAAAKRIPGSAPALLVTFGIIAAAAGLGSAAWAPGGSYWIMADAACAIALFAVGSDAGRVQRRSKEELLNNGKRFRRTIAFWIPIVVGFVLAIGFGSVYGSGASPVIRTALALSAALWLSSHSSGPSLLAAAIALALTSTPTVSTLKAAAVATGLLMALATAGGVARNDGSTGRAIRGIVPALSLGLAWTLRAIGLPWTAAGLITGFASGLERRLAEGGNSRLAIHRPAGSLAKRAATESAYALAFIAGFGSSSEKLGTAVPAIIVIACAVLASAALRTFISGTRTPYLPAEATAFAALLAAKRAGLASDAAVAGMAVAFLAALPLARFGIRALADASAQPTIKAIVGVSTKGATLGALSFAAAVGAHDDAIRAACVAAAEGSTGLSTSDAEEALVRCVATGATAEIRVLPSVVVSASIPDGLVRAALERRSDAIILGLGDRTRSAGKKYKTALDGLLIAFPGSVIAVRRAEVFPSSRRLVLVAVSGAEESPGFLAALTATARVWGRPTRSMEALMIGAPAATLVDAAEGLLDERNASTVDSWRDVPAVLATQTSQNTSFVVFSSRPGEKTWNPGYERLPVILDAAFPDSAVALWFLPRPPVEIQESEDTVQYASKLSYDGEKKAPVAESHPWPPIIATAWTSGRVMTDMHEAALVDAIRRLTDAVFPNDRGASGRLASEFSTIARKEPIELAPGVLLLHAHARGIMLPTVAIGARPAGWPLVALPSSIKITVALVSPEESGPEIHLEALTQIAAAFRNLGLADQLLSSAPPPPTT